MAGLNLKGFLCVCGHVSVDAGLVWVWVCVYCVFEGAPLCLRILYVNTSCFSAHSHSWKQCTMGDVTHAVHCSVSSSVPGSLCDTTPFWQAAKEESGGDFVLYLAGLRSGQEQPLKRTHLISGHTSTPALWKLFEFSSLVFLHSSLHISKFTRFKKTN